MLKFFCASGCKVEANVRELFFNETEKEDTTKKTLLDSSHIKE